MLFQTKTAAPEVPAGTVAYVGEAGGAETATWGERLVTVIATAIAVLVVATVAVLMGMA